VDSVWIVEGWFGDIEWIEAPAYATRELAEAECQRLWETRRSQHGPDYAAGLHKFAIRELDVRG
jgi:hypothetical protein